MEGVFSHNRFTIRFALVKAHFAYGVAGKLCDPREGGHLKWTMVVDWKEKHVAEMKYSVKSSKNAM